jgi:hypothetical protein
LKAETPAEGILKTNEWGDSKVYRVSCECGASDHDHHLWVEADEQNISVTIYTNLKSNWWSKTRWHAIWTLLTKGYVETEATILMREQQALNYAETLKSAVKNVKAFRSKNDPTNKAASKIANEGDCV